MDRRGVVLALLAASLLCGARSAPLHAEDAPASGPARSVLPLETRLYPDRSLLRGHPAYQMDRGPAPVAPEDVNSEAWPLFGRESGDRVYDFRTSDGLVFTLREATAESKDWEQDGVSIGHLLKENGVAGDDLLLVTAPRDLQAKVSAWLDHATHDALRTVVLDVAAFRGDAGAAHAEGGITATVARGAWAPLGVVRMTMHPAGGAVGRAGAIRAFVQDHDVEVAIDASTSLPIVGVAPEGLAVEASSVPTEGDRVSVHLRGWWASPPSWSTVSTGVARGAGDAIEVPEVETASFEVTVALSDDAWTLLPGSGPVVFVARARVESVPPSAVPAKGVAISPSVAAPAAGPLVSRTYPVGDLVFPVESARGWTAMLRPTNFTPPEPPPLPEAAPAFSLDSLVRIFKLGAWNGTWEREGAALAASERDVRATTDDASHEQLAALLARLRAARLKPTSIRVRVVAVPWASLPEWWTGLPDDLTKDDGAALLARSGARVVENGSLLLHDGQHRAVIRGARRSYVAGYGMEIASSAVIGKPLVASLFEGASFDIESDPVFGAPAASLSLRLDTDRTMERRAVATRFGEIECPVLELARSRGEATVPLDSTRVVAAWASDGEIRLVLVTAKHE
jgi:hypothetical protein